MKTLKELVAKRSVYVTPLPFSPVQFQYIISATNGNKRRNLMLNKILYYQSLPSVTYILALVYSILPGN